jgi:L-cysteine S-thiosulfotransferase
MPSLRHALPRVLVLAATLLVAASWPADAQQSGLLAYRVAGDAIPEPLGGLQGDAVRGRAVVVDRSVGNCLICHHAPEPAERFMGEIGPDLAGIGSRLTAAQIRLRVVDQSLLNAKTVMPPYYRIDNLARVAERYRGKPVLDAQQVEDVVAYLMSLRS